MAPMGVTVAMVRRFWHGKHEGKEAVASGNFFAARAQWWSARTAAVSSISMAMSHQWHLIAASCCSCGSVSETRGRGVSLAKEKGRHACGGGPHQEQERRQCSNGFCRGEVVVGDQEWPNDASGGSGSLWRGGAG
jgi:hypothetical protein